MVLPIRYLHLSDFHVGKDGYAQNNMFREILKHIEEKQKQDWVPDIVFITGDIANRGQAEEYETFAYDFLIKLYEIFGKAWQGSILAVPGNHDVDRDKIEFLARDEICQADRKVFDATKSGLTKRQNFLLPGVRAYLENDDSRAPKNWLDSPAGTFSQVLEIRNMKLGIVGINTAWLSKDDKDKGNLTPGVDLVKEALEQLQDCDARIVLGHHPLDWFLEKDAERIRQIFGIHGVLYLHGHLHKARAKGDESSGGKPFLNIQAGAAFQARDDEVWKNGLLWGELDLEQQQIRLQPRHWSADHQGWVLSSEAFHPQRQLKNADWWVFSLPGTKQLATKSPTVSNQSTFPKVMPPTGWNLENHETLASRRAALEKNELSEQEALQYFDGSTPSLRIVLSQIIPQREIVRELCDALKSGQGQDKPTVVLLLGAGGEGKSTAVFQTLVTLVEFDPSWQVLWRHDVDANLLGTEILALPKDGRKWLIASDDADGIAGGAFETVRALRKEQRDDVQFLLTCRDTDWIASGKEAKPPRDWSAIANFQQKCISGLSRRDATVVVQAWQKYGDKGLGQLSGRPEAMAVQLLMDSAEQESTTGEGAFFGAMLKMRLGDKLKDHLLVLLNRFATREIPGGSNLQQAFAYIAAMHAEGLMFLSKPVLAKVLRCEKQELKSKVLFPLGKEAAAIQAGNFILTRHKTIAQAVVEILSEQFGEDVDELYVDLAKAAIAARVEGEHIPELQEWDFSLPGHFKKSQRFSLAIKIAKGICEKDPDDPYRLVNLAKLYRDAEDISQAIELFRKNSSQARGHRSFFAEWGNAESHEKNYPLAVWISALTLADQVSMKRPDNQNAKIGFTLLGTSFLKLYDDFNNRIFVEGLGAIANLGFLIADRNNRQDQRYFGDFLNRSSVENVPDMDWQTALRTFPTAIQAAYELCGEKDDFPSLPSPSGMTFKGLTYLIDNAVERHEQRRKV
ncbi:MAG: metallophosphoesterase [Nostoc sp.]|uniref:metallophosphoesterase n=1 Tax=Nostoc sp. TaxID=1180 RepID=UPI002FF9D2E6